jgi:hypothetical protein
MKHALTLLAALTLFALAPSIPQAHATCLTGSALDTYAATWFKQYECSNYGICDITCGQHCSGTNDREECARFNQAAYWRLGTTHSCTGGNDALYTLYVHPTTWQSSGVLIHCFCFANGTLCQFQ